MIDIVPEGYENTPLNLFDRVRVIKEDILSYKNQNKSNHAGMITELDEGSEWKYKVTFADNTSDWFKRWHLKKIS